MGGSDYDIIIDRKTKQVLKTTPLDPERCAQFLAPIISREAATTKKNK